MRNSEVNITWLNSTIFSLRVLHQTSQRQDKLIRPPPRVTSYHRSIILARGIAMANLQIRRHYSKRHKRASFVCLKQQPPFHRGEKNVKAASRALTCSFSSSPGVACSREYLVTREIMRKLRRCFSGASRETSAMTRALLRRDTLAEHLEGVDNFT